MHPEIPAIWQQILVAVVAGPLAWRTPAEVATCAGREVEETTDVLAELDVAGWVEVWDRDEGPAVTLSPLAAARLLLRLVEGGPDQYPRWSRVGEVTPRAIRCGASHRATRGDALASALDTHPGPLLAAMHNERAASPDVPPATDPGHAPPRPTLLIGHGLSPWPGPARAARPPCPACAGLPLKPHMYCLCCDGWGRDRPDAPARPKVGPIDRRLADPRRAVAERYRRRSRRKARFHAGPGCLPAVAPTERSGGAALTCRVGANGFNVVGSTSTLVPADR